MEDPKKPFREEVAEYLIQRQDEIKAVARRRLTSHTKRVYDSDDIMQTVLRRLDEVVENSDGASGSELWPLALTIARNIAVSRTRFMEQARRLLREDEDYGSILLRRLEKCGSDDDAAVFITRMLHWVPDPANRQIVIFRMRSVSFKAMGQALDLSEENARQRWKSCKDLIVERVRDELTRED